MIAYGQQWPAPQPHKPLVRVQQTHAQILPLNQHVTILGPQIKRQQFYLANGPFQQAQILIIQP